MKYTIYSVELTKLQQVNAVFTEQFFKDIVALNPLFGKEYDNYFLVNTNLTINDNKNLSTVKYFNIFVLFFKLYAPIIQIIKK